MALEAEIWAFRDRVLDDLDSAHDYYSDTKIGQARLPFIR